MSSKINIVEPQVISLDYLKPIEKIEYAYRTCYQSRHLMTDGSHKLITKLLYPENGGTPHSSPLEHVTVQMCLFSPYADTAMEVYQRETGKYFIQWYYHSNTQVVELKGSLRAFFELWTDKYDPEDYSPYTILQYAVNKAICDNFDVFKELPPVQSHSWHKDIDFDNCVEEFTVSSDTLSFNIITTRDILQELVRHRKASFSVESTRYCNYKTKGFTFVRPRPYDWCDTNNYQYKLWYQSCQDACDTYLKMLEQGARPEEARMVLPGGLKTELVMTADKEYWKYFLKLRDHETAHPQIRLIAKEIGRYV